MISSYGAQEDFAARIVTASQQRPLTPPGDLRKFILLLISLKSLQIKVLVAACAERCDLQDTAAVLFKDIQKMTENYQHNAIDITSVDCVLCCRCLEFALKLSVTSCNHTYEWNGSSSAPFLSALFLPQISALGRNCSPAKKSFTNHCTVKC